MSKPKKKRGLTVGEHTPASEVKAWGHSEAIAEFKKRMAHAAKGKMPLSAQKGMAGVLSRMKGEI